MIKLMTAGESHGESLIGIIEGIPANLSIDVEYINKQLSKRQKGFGRSERMTIEKDEINIISGVNNGLTTGAPIAISIKNKGTNIPLPEVIKPRPGHGDLVGALKYDQVGGRNILERASARETAMKVALGSICNLFLKEFNIEIYSHVINIGGIKSNVNYYSGLEEIHLVDIQSSEINVVDKNSEKEMIKLIQNAKEDGDTLGGRIELIAKNLPVGLGSHINWEKKLDAKLAYAIMGIQGIKSVEFGMGSESSNILGSNYQDEIIFEDTYKRKTNHAGGIEAGMSNGEDLVVRATMKPIPTLRKPLETVDMITKEKVTAQFERSDVCAVASASIVVESMVAYVLANAFIEKFGGDSMREIKANYSSYKAYLESR